MSTSASLPCHWQASPAGPIAALRAAGAEAPPLLIGLDRRDRAPLTDPAVLAAGLSPWEQQRLQAYRRAEDRDRFLDGRGLLRAWLGCWLNLAPAAVPLRIGPHGKPFCPGGPSFNLSHSGDLILLVLHPCRPVGVDVEQRRPGLDWLPIARRLWGAGTLERLQALPEAEQEQAFLQFWCRTEAVGKATGRGLAEASQPDRVTPDCRLWDLELPAGYCGAVALLVADPAVDRRPRSKSPGRSA